MGAALFYIKCCKWAWHVAFHGTHAFIFLVSALVPPIKWLSELPWTKENIPSMFHAWQQYPYIEWAPVSILVLYFLARLVYAPYALFKDVEAERDQYKARALDKIHKTKIRDDLSQFLTEVTRLCDECRKVRGTKEEVQAKDKELRARIFNYLSSEPGLGKSYVARFGSGSGVPVPALEGRFLGRGSFHGKLYERLYWQSVRLQEFIKEFSS